MDFKEYLENSARQINDQLDQIFADFLNEVKKEKPKLIPFALGLINSCKGGKRIRGTLVKLGYEIAGGFPNEDILKIAAALEILHSAILVHDDIIDQSPTRRGQPSLYKVLGGDHYGISQAISLGDIGLYLPIQIIAESAFPDEFKNKALSHLSKTIVDTGWGEVLDVDLAAKKGKTSEEDIILLYKLKTAQYTISGPLILGAILAGADEELVREFGEFGENAGIAFQIQDDILDGEAQSVKDAKAKALKYALAAKKVIPKITKDSKVRKILEEMTEYLIERRN